MYNMSWFCCVDQSEKHILYMTNIKNSLWTEPLSNFWCENCHFDHTIRESLDLFKASSLNIAHLNVNGLRSKLDFIKILLKQEKFDILCLSETKIDSTVSDSDVKVPGYVSYRQDRTAHMVEGFLFMLLLNSRLTDYLVFRKNPMRLCGLRLGRKCLNLFMYVPFIDHLPQRLLIMSLTIQTISHLALTRSKKVRKFLFSETLMSILLKRTTFVPL